MVKPGVEGSSLNLQPVKILGYRVYSREAIVTMRRVNGRGLKIWRPDALEACGIRQREAEADVEGLSAAPPTPRWIQIPGKKITSRHKDREGAKDAPHTSLPGPCGKE